MKAVASSPDDSNEPGRGKEAKPVPDAQDLLNSQDHSPCELRDNFREVRKHMMRGAAFEMGKEAFQEFLRMLTEN